MYPFVMSEHFLCDKEWNHYPTTRRTDTCQINVRFTNPISSFFWVHMLSFPHCPAAKTMWLCSGQWDVGGYEWHLHIWNIKPEKSSVALPLPFPSGWIQRKWEDSESIGFGESRWCRIPLPFYGALWQTREIRLQCPKWLRYWDSRTLP